MAVIAMDSVAVLQRISPSIHVRSNEISAEWYLGRRCDSDRQPGVVLEVSQSGQSEFKSTGGQVLPCRWTIPCKMQPTQ